MHCILLQYLLLSPSNHFMFQDPGQPKPPPPTPPLPCLKYILIVDSLTVSTVIATFSNIKCVPKHSVFIYQVFQFFPIIDSEGC